MQHDLKDAVRFRLTLNKPAQVEHFPGKLRTMRIRLDQRRREVFIRAAPPSEDAVVLLPKDKGGFSALIEGPQGDLLLATLKASASPARPFFILEPANDPPWLRLVHYDRDGTPPRVWPHLRLWFSDAVHRIPIRPTPVRLDSIQKTLGPFVALLREAKQVVDADLDIRRSGRPTVAVREAKARLDRFWQLAGELLPGNQTVTPDALEQALLQRVGHATRAAMLAKRSGRPAAPILVLPAKSVRKPAPRKPATSKAATKPSAPAPKVNPMRAAAKTLVTATRKAPRSPAAAQTRQPVPAPQARVAAPQPRPNRQADLPLPTPESKPVTVRHTARAQPEAPPRRPYQRDPGAGVITVRRRDEVGGRAM